MNKLAKFLAMALVVTGVTQAKAMNQASNASQYAKYGFTSETDMQNYFTVDRVEVTETPNKISREELDTILGPVIIISPTTPRPTPAVDPLKPISDSVGIDISAWITLGQKIWQVIVANKPVANVSTQRVAVLPSALSDWSQMENWKGPATNVYTVEAKNLYGATVISHTYVIARNYGGQLNGKGAFLANATVIPTSVSVGWGFSLNSQVEVGQTVNMGTKDDPKPALDLQLQWKMDSILKHLEGRDSFFVKGDGSMQHITAP
jgi:hypothetical protein